MDNIEREPSAWQPGICPTGKLNPEKDPVWKNQERGLLIRNLS